MTPKELLYIEDALGHETEMQTVFCDFASQMNDADLQQFVQEISQKQSDDFKQLYALLDSEGGNNGR